MWQIYVLLNGRKLKQETCLTEHDAKWAVKCLQQNANCQKAWYEKIKVKEGKTNEKKHL